jgi:hypothetical protein
VATPQAAIALLVLLIKASFVNILKPPQFQEFIQTFIVATCMKLEGTASVSRCIIFQVVAAYSVGAILILVGAFVLSLSLWLSF